MVKRNVVVFVHVTVPALFILFDIFAYHYCLHFWLITSHIDVFDNPLYSVNWFQVVLSSRKYATKSYNSNDCYYRGSQLVLCNEALGQPIVLPVMKENEI